MTQLGTGKALRRIDSRGWLIALTAPILLLSPAIALGAAAVQAGPEAASFVDSAVRPGDDFYRHANGAWLARTTLASDQVSIGAGAEMADRARQQVLDIARAAAERPTSPGQRTIGDFFASFMDEAALERQGGRPLAEPLARLRAAGSHDELATLMGENLGGLGISLFSLYGTTDPDDPGSFTFRLFQDGLGLSARDDYLGAGSNPLREAYAAYVERSLRLVDWPDAAEAARSVLAFERAIAERHWPDERTGNPWARGPAIPPSDLARIAPGFPWNRFLAGAGLDGMPRLILVQEEPARRLAELYRTTPLETLRAWQAFHLVDRTTPYLSAQFLESRQPFIAALTGQQAPSPRVRRALFNLNDLLGPLVGEEYAARHFSPALKARIEAMVAPIKSAMRQRLRRNGWMAPTTKAQAIDKLDRMRIRIGFPERPQSFAGLALDRADLAGNVRQILRHRWRQEIARMTAPIDRDEWQINPQTPDAHNSFQLNAITFPAAYLQPPFFDPTADTAANFGSLGFVIGHEIVHAFDDQGRRYDGRGRVRDWWTAADAARFTAEADKLVAQVAAFEPLPGSRVDGRRTLGENLADIGGLQIALDGFRRTAEWRRLTRAGRADAERRLLLAFAQSWRTKQTEQSLRRQLASLPHAPAEVRVNSAVQHLSDWHTLYKVGPGDRLFLAPDRRIALW